MLSAYSHFNSIKVRLEPLMRCFLFLFNIFQFHKGAIRTFTYFLTIKDYEVNFNSIKVRLELQCFRPLPRASIISIP